MIHESCFPKIQSTHTYHTERWLSWSKAHDWKSCSGLYPDEGSNPSLSATYISMIKPLRIILEGFLYVNLNQKDKGVEVYFEKENIYTFDGKGELLITIMSSLAREESRSIS